jgi:hypothetical protein
VDPLVDALERVAAAGVVDGVTVRAWGHQLDWSTSCAEGSDREAIRDRVVAVQRWARREGVRVPISAPATAGYGRMGPAYEEIDLPEALLVEFVDGAVVHVTPHRRGREGVTIEERLRELRVRAEARERATAGETERSRVGSRRRSRSGSRRRPGRRGRQERGSDRDGHGRERDRDRDRDHDHESERDREPERERGDGRNDGGPGGDRERDRVRLRG